MDFELWLKKRFNLILMGEAKWYLGMSIRQGENQIIINQDQYVKIIDQSLEPFFTHPTALDQTLHMQLTSSQNFLTIPD